LQMEKDDKGSTMIRMGVSGWMSLLVPAYPGCPGSKAVKRSLSLSNFVDVIWPMMLPDCYVPKHHQYLCLSAVLWVNQPALAFLPLFGDKSGYPSCHSAASVQIRRMKYTRSTEGTQTTITKSHVIILLKFCHNNLVNVHQSTAQ